MIIVLEGADCTGKTTLAKMIHENSPGSVYLHNGPNDNSVFHYMDQLTRGSGVGAPLTIIDRMWLSELIYGSIVRNSVTSDILKVVKFFNCLSAVMIMCVRADLTAHLKHFESLDREEYGRSHISQIVKMYHDLWYGTAAKMPHHALDIISTIPMCKLRGYYQYDMDKQTPEQFTNWILRLYK